MNQATIEAIIGFNITQQKVTDWNTANNQDITRNQAINIIREGIVQTAADILTRQDYERLVTAIYNDLIQFQQRMDTRLVTSSEQTAIADAIAALATLME